MGRIRRIFISREERRHQARVETAVEDALRLRWELQALGLTKTLDEMDTLLATMLHETRVTEEQ